MNSRTASGHTPTEELTPCAVAAGGKKPEIGRMPLPLPLTPQNYNRGYCEAVCSFCTSVVHSACVGVGWGVLDLFWTLCQDVYGFCIGVDEPIGALLTPKDLNGAVTAMS
jgi:hypothetical protein